MTFTPTSILHLALAIGQIFLLLAFLLAFLRLVSGPTLPDRVVALDLMTVIAAAFVLVLAIFQRQQAFVDVAIALGLIAFLATIAFARYILTRGEHLEDRGNENLNVSGNSKQQADHD